MAKDCSRLTIEPVTLQNRLLARFESLKPLDELLPEFDDVTARDDKVF